MIQIDLLGVLHDYQPVRWTEASRGYTKAMGRRTPGLCAAREVRFLMIFKGML